MRAKGSSRDLIYVIFIITYVLAFWAACLMVAGELAMVLAVLVGVSGWRGRQDSASQG